MALAAAWALLCSGCSAWGESEACRVAEADLAFHESAVVPLLPQELIGTVEQSNDCDSEGQGYTIVAPAGGVTAGKLLRSLLSRGGWRAARPGDPLLVDPWTVAAVSGVVQGRSVVILAGPAGQPGSTTVLEVVNA